MASTSSKAPDAYAVARRLHDVTEMSRQAFDAAAGRLGLTAAQARVILRLFEPTPMSELANHLGCDASNITGIAARLLDREFVTSTPGPDRRVKLLGLTPRGRRLRAELEREINRNSPSVDRLSDSERRTLIHLLDKLAGVSDAGRG